MQNKKIVLASASPRRKELLQAIGLEFEIIPADIDETLESDKFSLNAIEKLALDKALDVSKRINYPALIIGSDTVVVIDDQVLGKPKDKEDAFTMLNKLSGRTHKVISAIAIYDTVQDKTLVDSVSSEVTFREMTDKEITNYIESSEPMDKAGAYAIQGIGGIFVSSICGCYSNIVGISIFKLAEMLKAFGISVI